MPHPNGQRTISTSNGTLSPANGVVQADQSSVHGRTSTALTANDTLSIALSTGLTTTVASSSDSATPDSLPTIFAKYDISYTPSGASAIEEPIFEPERVKEQSVTGPLNSADKQSTRSGTPCSIDLSQRPCRDTAWDSVPCLNNNKNSGIPHLPIDDFINLVEEYATILEGKFSLPDRHYEKFAAPRTAQEVLNEHRLPHLLRVLIKSRCTNELQIEVIEERTERLVQVVQERGMHTMLAILVYMRCNHMDFERFTSKIIEESLEPSFCDEAIPFSMDLARAFFGVSLGKRFHEAQSIFAPLILVEGRKNKCSLQLGQPQRLPFIERGFLGSGAAGRVSKVTIEIGCLKDSKGVTNTKPIAVAQKVFIGDSEEEVQYIFQEEREIHFRIAKGPRRHDNVVHCLGSLEIDNEPSLLFPLADGNLEDILTGRLPWEDSLSEIFQRAAALCRGLDHLAHGLTSDGVRIIGYHMDFRPQNVLVDGKQWKVADFGLTKLRDRKPEVDTPLQWTSDRRGEGAYVSPEASTERRVYPVSDLWSLACVLIEILTFAVGRHQLLSAFRKTRCTDKGHDMFFVTQGDIAMIRSEVSQWCENLPKLAHHHDVVFGEVISEVLHFLQQKLLIVDVKRRGEIRASDVAVMLDKASAILKQAGTPMAPAELFAGTILPSRQDDPLETSDSNANRQELLVQTPLTSARTS